MTEQLFAFDERNYRDCQTAFRGQNNQEYYLGEYTIDKGENISVRADRKAVGTCSIIRLQSKSRLHFRRSWSHIREDATDVTIIWFIKHGNLHLSHQSGFSIASAGEFGITKSMSPFSLECIPDEQSRHELLHIVLPTHIFRRYVPEDINTGFCRPTLQREFQIAERIFSEVLEDSEELTERVEKILVDSALAVLAEGIRNSENAMQERKSLTQKRIQDVLRYVEIHLSDPKLNAERVAKACGISRRYLSHLLQQLGTSFPGLVWNWRLKTAHDWLSLETNQDISISELAFRIGFKSPAHFSRLFKQVYKITPREFRASKTKNSISKTPKDTCSGGLNSIQ